MLNISLSKHDFENIISLENDTIYKDTNKFWSNKFLEPKLIDDGLVYDIRSIKKLSISNGLGDDKPSIIIECKELAHLKDEKKFKIVLGKILEHKNTDIHLHKDSMIEQLLKEKQELEERIHRDHLTGVYNRTKMESDLDSFINSQTANFLSAVFIDADRFKGINDNFGHDTGDRALIYIANKLQRHAKRMNGEVYRYGGEEFILLAFSQRSDLLISLENLKEDIKSDTIYHPKKEISLTVSMGVSFWNESKNKFEFIKKADNAVYKAKETGRDKIVVL